MRHTYQIAFLYRKGSISAVRVRPVTRQGKTYYRDTLGVEYPARMVKLDLDDSDRDTFVASYNRDLREMYNVNKVIHPEDQHPYVDLSYCNIIALLTDRS